MADNNKNYNFILDLNILNHLGVNLYSNTPAVLSEVVANSWDADAENVYINIEDEIITIEDDGLGMDYEDLKEKFLRVGYQKRISDKSITSRFHRKVMGRKGIGKLSLFSIAEVIKLYSFKNGEKNGFIINVNDLKEKITEGSQTYSPQPIPENEVPLNSNGTKIMLYELKKSVSRTHKYLKKRLARRFSVISDNYNFNVFINREKITIEDRDFFNKLKDIWIYKDEEDVDYKNYCANIKFSNYRKTQIEGTDYKVKGWIGAVEESGNLKIEDENLNKISIIVRGKVAQEDILDEFTEGGLYTKYLIGEIHADFLDDDDEKDITTSSRQKIIEDDERYISLKKFIQNELKNIAKEWNEQRDKTGLDEAKKITVIDTWYNDLSKDNKTKAKKLFGKINKLTVLPEEKKQLYKHSVLAFESLKYKENLDLLDNISTENITILNEIIDAFDDIEATLYHQIVTERLKIIELLKDKVEDNALEKVIQEHLYNHLWLLDPSWDRATEGPLMESTMKKEFETISDSLTEEERRARIDIKYKKTSGKHIIIELKRAGVQVNFYELLSQIDKYRKALKKQLTAIGKFGEPVEIICLLGQEPKEWKNTSESDIEEYKDQLKEKDARIVFYKQLVEDSYRSYDSFIKGSESAGRVTQLIKSIDDSLQ